MIISRNRFLSSRLQEAVGKREGKADVFGSRGGGDTFIGAVATSPGQTGDVAVPPGQ